MNIQPKDIRAEYPWNTFDDVEVEEVALLYLQLAQEADSWSISEELLRSRAPHFSWQKTITRFISVHTKKDKEGNIKANKYFIEKYHANYPA
jgi:hypothetical protein